MTLVGCGDSMVRCARRSIRIEGVSMTAVLIIRIHVKSYDAWRTSFDAHIGFRRENGVTSSEVYCSPVDMTSVAVLATFDSVDTASAFVANPELAEVMKAGGVIGAPNITITEVV